MASSKQASKHTEAALVTTTIEASEAAVSTTTSTTSILSRPTTTTATTTSTTTASGYDPSQGGYRYHPPPQPRLDDIASCQPDIDHPIVLSQEQLDTTSAIALLFGWAEEETALAANRMAVSYPDNAARNIPDYLGELMHIEIASNTNLDYAERQVCYYWRVNPDCDTNLKVLYGCAARAAREVWLDGIYISEEEANNLPAEQVTESLNWLKHNLYSAHFDWWEWSIEDVEQVLQECSYATTKPPGHSYSSDTNSVAEYYCWQTKDNPDA